MFDPRLSITIDRLRLPLCLGVVAIHCGVSSMSAYDAGPMTNLLVNLPILALYEIRVPLFFMIAGYLTGYKTRTLSRSQYSSLIYKRTRSLLIPYLIWNIFALIIRTFVRLSPLGIYTSSTGTSNSSWGFMTNLFWTPELEPLWFIRDLYIMYLVLPVIYWLTKYLSWFSMILFWILSEYFGYSGVFYFALGCMLAKDLSQEKFTSAINNKILLYPLFLILETTAFIYGFNVDTFPLANTLLVLIGSLGFASLVWQFPSMFRLVTPGYVFFVYAIHGLLSPYFIKAVVLLLQPLGIGWIAVYYIVLFGVLALSTALWLVTKRYFPHTAAVITGRRSPRLTTPL
ncbi:MAG: acyltransferase [Bacteroides sp.]|nr:acyltransferase [Bacteroides sp.]